MTAGRYRVVWTDIALGDIERLASRLQADAPLRAERILTRILDRAESLERSPARGRTLPELRGLGDRTWREIQEPPWRIVYRISGRKVEVHCVLDGRRSLDDVLMERLLDS